MARKKQRKPLEGLRVSVVRSMRGGLKKTAEVLRDRIVENASLTDHSLDALEKLGHPYAVRDLRPLHTPSFQVHKQSGKLVDNVEIRQVNQFAIDVGVDEDKVPYVRHVIRGTKFMISRDFISGSFNEVKDELTKVINKAVRKGVDEA